MAMEYDIRPCTVEGCPGTMIYIEQVCTARRERLVRARERSTEACDAAAWVALR